MVDLRDLYRLLKGHWGRLSWWPADSDFEVAVGAILTQRTAWRNVESAVAQIKDRNLLHPEGILGMPESELTGILRPCGFYRQKSDYLRGFCRFVMSELGGDLGNLKQSDLEVSRRALLSVRGIGQETADSILLYACGHPTFVIDAYTRRIVSRLERTEMPEYRALKRRFESEIHPDLEVYRQYHALLVELGKQYCRPVQACSRCPATGICLSRDRQ